MNSTISERQGDGAAAIWANGTSETDSCCDHIPCYDSSNETFSKAAKAEIEQFQAPLESVQFKTARF